MTEGIAYYATSAFDGYVILETDLSNDRLLVAHYLGDNVTSPRYLPIQYTADGECYMDILGTQYNLCDFMLRSVMK